MTTWATLAKSPNCASQDDQTLRLGGAVAVLEPEHRHLREHGVDDAEAGLPFEEVLERGVGAEPLLVVEDRMTVEERAALAVLARQAHRVSVLQQGGVREVLRESPVHRPFAARHLQARPDDSLDASVELEVVRRILAEPASEPFDALDGHGGVAGCAPAGADVRRPVGEKRVVRVVDQRSGHHVVRLQCLEVPLRHRLGLARLDHALGHQPIAVDHARSVLLANPLVHHGLGRERLVGLVVAVAAKADHVDDDVLPEPHPEVEGEPGDEHHGLRIVSVHVEDGRLYELCDIGAVQGRARVERVAGGEADLVVHHDMDGSARAVPARLGEVEGLGHHPHGPENAASPWTRIGRTWLRSVSPRRSCRALTDPSTTGLMISRCDGIEREHQVHRAARSRHRGGEPEVVLDVAGARADADLSFELAEQDLGMLAEDIHQDVEAAAVGHADDRLANASFSCVLNDLVEQGNEILAALEREALLADVLAMQVVLQLPRRGDPVQDVPFLLGVESRAPAGSVRCVPEPTASARSRRDE